MATLTFQVLDGADRGRSYRDVPAPAMIGREEGNQVQLNDERVSRFHAKVQEDNGQFIITDLDSTNGTKVNGEHVTLGILRPGDRVTVGRSVLLFGSPEEIAHTFGAANESEQGGNGSQGPTMFLGKTRPAENVVGKTGMMEPGSGDLSFELNGAGQPSQGAPADTPSAVVRPELPRRLSPGQAAQVGEILLYLLRSITGAIDPVRGAEADGFVRVPAGSWQQILHVALELARYHRAIGQPDDERESRKP